MQSDKKINKYSNHTEQTSQVIDISVQGKTGTQVWKYTLDSGLEPVEYSTKCHEIHSLLLGDVSAMRRSQNRCKCYGLFS